MLVLESLGITFGAWYRYLAPLRARPGFSPIPTLQTHILGHVEGENTVESSSFQCCSTCIIHYLRPLSCPINACNSGTHGSPWHAAASSRPGGLFKSRPPKKGKHISSSAAPFFFSFFSFYPSPIAIQRPLKLQLQLQLQSHTILNPCPSFNTDVPHGLHSLDLSLSPLTPPSL